MTTILVLNGPNLGQLGARETSIYGDASFQDLRSLCSDTAEQLGVKVDVRQTDAEHEMLAWLHEAAAQHAPVVINPAGWTHTSVALRDGVAMLTAPAVEVHISNVHAREEFRRVSLITPVVTGIISGLGIEGYALAIRFLVARTL